MYFFFVFVLLFQQQKRETNLIVDPKHPLSAESFLGRQKALSAYKKILNGVVLRKSGILEDHKKNQEEVCVCATCHFDVWCVCVV